MPDFIVDTESCVQCGECVKDCVVSCLEMKPEYPRLVPGREDTCIKCGHCLAICPTASVQVDGKSPEDSAPIKRSFPEPEQLSILMRGRRSVRRYKKEAVPPETMEKLYDVLAAAPTGVNDRRLLFTVVDDPAVMDRIREKAVAGVLKAVDDDTLPPGMDYIKMVSEVARQGVDIFFCGAPHMLIITAPKDSPCPEADPIIAMSYFEMMATALNIGTVWCGFAKWIFFNILPEMRQELGIPDDHVPGYVMMFGMPDVKYHRTVERGPARVNIVG